MSSQPGAVDRKRRRDRVLSGLAMIVVAVVVISALVFSRSLSLPLPSKVIFLGMASAAGGWGAVRVFSGVRRQT